MAVTIGASADIVQLRLNQLGAYNETANNAVPLTGTATDADIIQALTDWDAVSRVGFPKVTLNAQRVVSGMSAAPASQDALSKVNDMISLNFTQVHPLNPALMVSKSVQVRAPSSVVIGTNGALVVASTVGDRSSADENLRGLISFLEANLIYEDITGAITIGGWTWDAAGSAYISSGAVIDGV